MKIILQLLKIVDGFHMGYFLGDIDAILEID